MIERDEVIVIRQRQPRPAQGSGWAGALIVMLAAWAFLTNLGRQTADEAQRLAAPPEVCIDQECVNAYGSFMASNSGRAFVVSGNGIWAWRAGEESDTAAAGKSLAHCAALGGANCRVAVLGSALPPRSPAWRPDSGPPKA